MTPDDPRHGSEAGCEQHYRDSEEPCAPCYDAKLRASRRRTKLKTMGYRFRLPVGAELHGRLVRLEQRGASHQMIAGWSGLSQPLISRIFRQGPEAVVSWQTKAKLSAMRVRLPVTPIGATRRIQALAFLGWSADRVAREAGLHEETVKNMRKKVGAQIMSETAEKLSATYDRLSMVRPTGGTKQERAGVSRSRNMARRLNWVPPLAWTDIDDPDETPTDWEYRPERHRKCSRKQVLADLVDAGSNISEACRTLHMSRDTLQTWCRRNQLSELYLTLTSRERLAPEKYAEEVA